MVTSAGREEGVRKTGKPGRVQDEVWEETGEMYKGSGNLTEVWSNGGTEGSQQNVPKC